MRVLARALTLGPLGVFLIAAPSAFAQDPNAVPPQTYPQPQDPQQPPQQYPQAQPPQQPPQQYPQAQPPQQYPQYPQQYPQQQYPQQYPQAYPPAGYAAPAPAAPPVYQPMYAPPPAPAHTDLRYGGLAMLTLGVNSVVGSDSDYFSSGFSMGGIFGGHLSRDLSLNGEIAINILNPDTASSDSTFVLVDFAFSPFYHFGQGNMEFMLGPKIGGYGLAVTYDGSDDKYSESGLLYGFNAAVFFQLSQTMAIGGLLNYTGHHPTKACVTYDGAESCSSSNLGDDLDLFTVNGALRW